MVQKTDEHNGRFVDSFNRTGQTPIMQKRTAHLPRRPLLRSPAGLGVVAFILTQFALSPAWVTSARADLRVCNDTKSMVAVAVGYRTKEDWISEGWWRIPAEVCTSIIEGDLASRFFYVHAENKEGNGRWRGPVFLCTSSKEFRIMGLKNCFSRGFEKSGFFEVDTGEQKNWQLRLTEANRTQQDTPSQ